MKIKIIAYNILTGFYNKDRYGNYFHNKNREKLAKQLIKKENPDIIILSESNWINHKKIKQNYMKIFGYKYGFFGSDGYMEDDWGVGILSKFKILNAYDYTTKHSRFVRAILEVNGKEVMVDCVHPDPTHNEHQRKQWFKTVVRDKKEPYIVAGDFNALSPQDKYDKKKLIREFENNFRPEDRYKATRIINDIIQGKAVNVLLKSGLQDTFKVKNKGLQYSYHTGMSGDMFSRLDYIFCSKDIKVLKSGIIHNNISEKASDHYPVYALLEV